MISQDELKTILRYNPEDGEFYRLKATSSRAPAGAIAGNHKYQKNRHVKICIGGRVYLAHRLVWLYVHGVWPSNEIDHIDRNGRNNRLSNLREASASQNKQNRVMPKSESGVTGVTWEKCRKIWRARIRVNNQKINLGSFKTKLPAIAARKAGEAKYFGQYAVKEPHSAIPSPEN